MTLLVISDDRSSDLLAAADIVLNVMARRYEQDPDNPALKLSVADFVAAKG